MRPGSILLALMAAAHTPAGVGPTGHYRLADGPDTASELILLPDGRFDYALAAGALDEAATGSWTSDGKVVRLTTRPKPVPAVFSAAAVASDPKQGLTIKAVAPDGSGIALIDFTITFADGSTEEGYTQDYGWSLPPEDHRVPRSITLGIAMYELVSPPFLLDPAQGNVFTFKLTPNDLGRFDFEATPLDIAPGKLIWHRGGADLEYRLSRGKQGRIAH